jgi:hypothetical protein
MNVRSSKVSQPEGDDALEDLKIFASVTTMIAAMLVAANWSPKTMVAGFAIFSISSAAWIYTGISEEEPSIYLQNAVLLLVNAAGIYRWLPKV